MIDTASAVETPAVDSTVVTETPAASGTNDDLQVVDASSETHTEEDSTKGKETETHNEDGSEKTPEQQEDFKAKAENREPLPAEIRSALKALREADPKNAAAVKALHGSWERWNAAKEMLGTGEGSGIVGLKQLLSAVGAKDLPALSQAYIEQSQMIESVKGTDELLYAADPVLSENVYEDMKAQGKEAMYGKVVSNFVEHLKTADPNAFYDNVAKPLFLQSMDEAKIPGALNALHKALVSGDTETAKAITKNIADFYIQLRDENGEKSKISKERQAWEQERSSKETESQKAERTKVESGIAEECDKQNNVQLGKYLGAFLRLPFFKDFPYETKVDLGNGIKDRLYATLKADKAYQTAMSTQWKMKTLNKAQMVQIHTSKLQEIGERIVRETIKNRYPGYAKGGSAAGKAAAAVVKKEAGTKAAAQSLSTMKPIYIASRPENLVRDSITVGGKTYQAEDLRTLQVMGRGFTKTPDGKGFRFVTWRR